MSDAHTPTPEATPRRLISAVSEREVGRASDGGLAFKARRSEYGRYELTHARLPIWQSLTPVTSIKKGPSHNLFLISIGLNACPLSKSGDSTQLGQATAGSGGESAA